VSRADEQALVAAALASFPRQFGLRGFPRDVFRCSETDSYVCDGSVVVYTERRGEDGVWRAFAKGAPAEVRREMVPCAMPERRDPARLDREILEIVSPPQPEASGPPGRELTARRAGDFRDSGNYEVRDETGDVIALIYRDPESRGWYEESRPGAPQTHYTERWRGSTQAEALASIARRRR
jgi:hypothetical protein